MERHITDISEMLNRKPEDQKVTAEKNLIAIIDGKLALEAIEDKIIILLDKYKNGYECKDCNETGKYIACECLRAGRELGVNLNGKKCAFIDNCSKQIVGNTCLTCKGTGSTLITPDRAKSIPTTGVIVSVGPECTKRHVGERVIFGAHTGYFLPFKGNAKIRCMREDEPLCLLYIVDPNAESNLNDFVYQEDTRQD